MPRVRDNALSFEAVKIALTQDKDGFVLKLRVHPDDMPEDMFRHWVGSRYGCALVRIDDDDDVAIAEAKRRGQKAVMIAGTLCKRPEFWKWLDHTHRHLIPEYLVEHIDNEEAAAASLRIILDVDSRKDIGNNQKALEKFREIVQAFESDLKKSRSQE